MPVLIYQKRQRSCSARHLRRPIRLITIGAGDKAVKVGEEVVLFRHDKKFFNPCGFAVAIKDTESSDEIKRK